MTAESKNQQTPEEIKKLSFEQALEELRKIVSQLEEGDGSLDEAISAYERGALLKQHCEEKLREAQAKIEKIQISANGTPSTEPFDT